MENIIIFFNSPLVLGIAYSLIAGIIIIIILKIFNFLLSKKTIINKCRNTNYYINKLSYKDFSIDPKTYNPYFREWELTRLLYNSILGENKLIIITGRSRTGKTRAVLETLKNLYTDNKDKYFKNLRKYIFINPTLELLKNPESRKLIPRNFLFYKRNFIIFFDDVLNLEFRGACITDFINDFYGKYNDVVVIMNHSKEELLDKNINLYVFLEKYRKELKLKNKKFQDLYLSETVIEVPDISLELLLEINNNLGIGRKDKKYLIENYDRTVQPLFYAESTSYSSFGKLGKDEQKIMYSSKLILNFGFFPFSKNLLFKVYKSKIFNGDINSFEIKLKKLVDLKFINVAGKENNYLYVDTGILSRAIKDYPYDNKFNEIDILTMFNVCIDSKELERIIYIARKLYISGQKDDSIKLLKEADKKIQNNLNIIMELGIQLSTINKNDEAIKVLEKALKIDSSLKQVWAMLSDLYIQVGSYAESNKAIKNAIRYGMDDPIIWYNYGNVLFYENKHSESEKAFKKALSMEKNDKKAWFNLGNSLKFQEKYYESEKAYKKALKVDEEYFNALVNLSEVLEAQGKIDEAISILERIPKTHPGYKIVEWNLGGLTYRKEEKKEEIKKENELLRNLNKKNKNIWFELLTNYIEKNKYSQAEDLAKRAIKFFKDTDGFYNLLGKSLYFQQRYEKSNNSFNKSKIKDYDSYLIWGCTLKLLKKHYEAHRVYIKALILNKNGKEVWHDIGLNLAEQKKYKFAIKSFLKAIEIDKNFILSHNALGACYSYLDDFVSAEREFKNVIAIEDKFILAWSNLGELYFQQKKYNLAEKAFKKAFGFFEETDKQLIECLDLLGKIDELKKYKEMMKSIIYKKFRSINF